MHAAGKIFVKTYLKAIRDTFFSQYVIFLSNRRGKLKLLGFQGDPTLPISLAKWDILSTLEENPEGGRSAYRNYFLSKQKIYSM